MKFLLWFIFVYLPCFSPSIWFVFVVCNIICDLYQSESHLFRCVWLLFMIVNATNDDLSKPIFATLCFLIQFRLYFFPTMFCFAFCFFLERNLPFSKIYFVNEKKFKFKSSNTTKYNAECKWNEKTVGKKLDGTFM